MQLKELLRQLKEGESVSFTKTDDAVGVEIAILATTSPLSDTASLNLSAIRTVSTQQITGTGADLVRDTIEEMLKEVRK